MQKSKKILTMVLAFAMCLLIGTHVSHAAPKKEYSLDDALNVLKAALLIHADRAEYDLNNNGYADLDDALLCLKYALRILAPPADDTPSPKPSDNVAQSEPPAVSNTPKPSDNVAQSELPAASNTPKPSDNVAQSEPPATLKPSEAPATPYISTDNITLSSDYSGSNATCAAITIHNIVAYNPDLSTDLKDYVSIYYKNGTCFVHPFYQDNQQLTAYETMKYSEELHTWIRLDPVVNFSDPVINGNSATFYITAVPYASGQFTIEIAYGKLQYGESGWDHNKTFTCSVSLYASLQKDITHTIVDEDEITISIGENETISGLGDFGYVSGGAVYIRDEGNFQTHCYDADTYTYLTYNNAVKETYLTTYGEYDEELTRAVREQLYREPTCDYPQDQLDYLNTVAEQWYKGEISFRTLRNTFRNTYREGWVSIGVLDYTDENGVNHYTYHHYEWQDWNKNGHAQNALIFKIPGAIDASTIFDTMHEMWGDWGYTIRGICFVRVHYDVASDTSYLYFIE